MTHHLHWSKSQHIYSLISWLQHHRPRLLIRNHHLGVFDRCSVTKGTFSLVSARGRHKISQNVWWWSGPSLSFLSLSHRELGSRWCRDHHALIEARLNSWMDLAFMTWGTCGGGGTEISYRTQLMMEYQITSGPFYNQTRNGSCFIQVFPSRGKNVRKTFLVFYG